MKPAKRGPPANFDARIASIYGIGCVAVVIGHATGQLPTAARALASVDGPYAVYLGFVDWLYTWHMPLFFAMAGALYARSVRRKGAPPLASVVRRRAVRLLLPYLTLTTLAFPLKAATSSFALHPVDFTLCAYLHSLVVPWSNPIIYFWFLPTLFLVSIAGSSLLRPHRTPKYDAVLLLVAVAAWAAFEHRNLHGLVSILNIGGALHNAVFYVGGFMAVRYLPLERLRQVPISLVSVAVSTLLLSIGLFLVVGAAPWAALPMACLGIVTACAAALVVRSKLLSRIGVDAFEIYLLSWFFLVPARLILTQLLNVNAMLTVLVSVVAGLCGPMLVMHYWRRLRLHLGGVPLRSEMQ